MKRKLRVFRDPGTGEIYGREIRIKAKKHEFKPWGSPEVFKSYYHNLNGLELWVYAKKGMISIKSMNPDNNGDCVVLTPKTIKPLIKLLQKTVSK